MKDHITRAIVSFTFITSIILVSLVPAGTVLATHEAVAPGSGEPVTSVVAGTDLYGEQMQFYLAGQTCLIRQSAITDDDYILYQVPLDDVAFQNASVLLFSTNGMYKTGYTDVYVPLNELVAFQVPINGFYVVLAYNHTSQSRIDARARMATQMLESALGIELFEIDDGESSIFTYYGVTPPWSAVIQTMLSQLPSDGYFKHLDTARLTSTSYLSSHHLSVGFVSLNIFGGNVFGVDIVGGLNGLMDQLGLNASDISDLLGLDFSEITGSIATGRTNIAFVQYEGRDGGIVQEPDGDYKFDIKRALGMDAGEPVKPSEMVWNSLMGLNPTGLLSTLIDVNVITGSVSEYDLGNSPLAINGDLLNTIYFGASLLGSGDIDIVSLLETLEFIIDNVFFITHWEKSGASTRLYANVNITREGIGELVSDFGIDPELLDYVLTVVNLQDSPLALVGFRGIPFVPSGLLVPLPGLTVTYSLDQGEQQPVLLVRHEIDSTIKPIDDVYDLDLTVTNVGSSRAWGMKLGRGVADLSTLTLGLLPLGTIAYDVRAFSIPSLISDDILAMNYGIENFLLDLDSYDGPGYIELALSLADGDGDGYVALEELGLVDTRNYLDPGESFSVPLSGSLSTGFYTAFENETGRLAGAWVVNGSEVASNGTNNQTNAYTFDFDTWDIQSANVSTNVTVAHDVVVNFTFSNVTGNFNPLELSALEFVYVGNTNVSIWANGTSNLHVYNYNTSTWIPVNNLTRTTVNINQTAVFSGLVPVGIDTFRIYEGDLDSQNATIHLVDYMAGPNYTASIQLRLSNNVPTLLEIDAFSMDYLRVNASSIPVPSKTIAYTDFQGSVIRQSASNSLVVSALNTSSIIVTQRVLSPNFYLMAPGQVRTLEIQLFNNGTRNAANVNVSVAIPGIITNPNGFTVGAATATISIPSIPASNTVTRSFQFTVPNSEKVPGAVITYDNQTQISANGSDFAVITNDLYIDAPVDYKSAGTSPAVIKLHGTTLLATPAHVPNVGESFPVNYSLSFTGLPAWVTTVGLPLLDTPFFDHAAPGGTVSVSIGAQGTGSSLSNTTKASPRGYLLLGWLVPDMALGSLVRYVPPAHVQIGQVALKIDKYVLQGATLISNAMTITRDELVSVQVKVTNTGTLPLGLVEEEDASNPLGFFVSDNFGYPQAAFVVVSGNVSAAALVLEPGNSTSFTYTVTATKVGVHELGAVEKEYLFITRRSTSSNSITVTVNEKPVLVLVYVGTSVGVLVAVVAFSAYDRKKQRRAWEEFKRTDKVLYEEIEKDEKRSYSEYLD